MYVLSYAPSLYQLRKKNNSFCIIYEHCTICHNKVLRGNNAGYIRQTWYPYQSYISWSDIQNVSLYFFSSDSVLHIFDIQNNYNLNCCMPCIACGTRRLQRLLTVASGYQPGRSFAPGQLRLSRPSVAEGKMVWVIMERRGHRRQCIRFPGICHTSEENPS